MTSVLLVCTEGLGAQRGAEIREAGGTSQDSWPSGGLAVSDCQTGLLKRGYLQEEGGIFCHHKDSLLWKGQEAESVTLLGIIQEAAQLCIATEGLLTGLRGFRKRGLFSGTQSH